MAIGARGEADAEGKEKEEAVRAGSGGHVVIARPDCDASPIAEYVEFKFDVLA